MHDFNPGVAANGLFWIIQIPDDAITVTDDTVTISLKDVAVNDQLTFPQTLPNGQVVNLGNSGVPAKVSFNITYQKSGPARHVRATSTDPLSPFNWAGEMSDATNSGTFSVTYTDGSFSAQGSFRSPIDSFGEMGTERNGSFVRREDRDGDENAAGAAPAAAHPSVMATPQANSPKWHGKVPVEYFFH